MWKNIYPCSKAEEGQGERVVTRAAAEELVVGDWCDVYVECSAKMGDNIGAVFRKLVSFASKPSYTKPAVIKEPADPEYNRIPSDFNGFLKKSIGFLKKS